VPDDLLGDVSDRATSSAMSRWVWSRRWATHRLPLAEAPHGYEIFQEKQDDCAKVVLNL